MPDKNHFQEMAFLDKLLPISAPDTSCYIFFGIPASSACPRFLWIMDKFY